MSNETTAMVERDTQSYKLPTSVCPSRYEIRLEPDLNNFTFVGQERVSIEVLEPVEQIMVNAVELQIQQAQIVGSGKTIAATVELDEANERAIFKFAQSVPKGKWELELKFTGILNDKLNGFYRSTYKDAQGNSKVLATTQFEATDARKAFPCWDEPEYKAVFGVTLVVDESLTAISNASVKSEKKLADKKKEVIFQDTMKMSTYLVAFLVGEFEGTEAVVVDGKPIKIYCVPGKKHLTGFSLDCAAASLDYFAKYYGIPYPGDKLDLIAIPDFASGAMENLGAVTFRETALLVDPKTASHAEQERVADVVAHELAHMWFGDLVTMKWWNGLWLNEAFATFMEMLAVDNWKPHWKRWDSFGVSRAAAFAVDALKSTRPIEFPVHHPDEAGAMFDVLTYEKGASVLRMLEQYLGVEEFRKGISKYLNKHAYANAETTDLWDAIEESSKQPVRQMMDSWIFQGGFPLVSVEANANGDGVVLSQQRFFSMPGQTNDQLFKIPVMLRAKTDKGEIRKKFILDQKSMAVELPGKLEWIVINDGGHGFYRTRYSKPLLDKLTSLLWTDLAVIERFNLVSDTWSSTVAGHTPLKDYLALAALFEQETDKNVWAVLIGSLHYLNKVIDDSARPKLEEFAQKLVGPIFKQLGWEPKAKEDELTKQLRGMVIGCLGTLGNDQAIQKQVDEAYKKYKADKSTIDANLVPALVGILAYTGNQARYEEFEREFKSAATPQEEQRYLFALAGFRDQKLLKKTLESAISGEVRSQNAPYLVQSVMSNIYGRELAWEFFQKDWDEMIKLYPENSIPRMCEGITNLVKPEWLEQATKFFATHEVKQGGKAIEQHLEKLKIAVLFKQRDGATIC
jgi:puromycin-sensitive aminopeptidase